MLVLYCTTTTEFFIRNICPFVQNSHRKKSKFIDRSINRQVDPVDYRQVDQPLIKNVAKKPEKTGKIISTCRIFLTLVISLPLLWTILFLIYKFEYKFESKRRNEVQIRIVDKAIKSNFSSPELDSKRAQLMKKRFWEIEKVLSQKIKVQNLYFNVLVFSLI